MAGSKTILLIEDDRFISEMYARSLRKAGFEVDEVITGPEGLKAAKTGAYAIVLLDIMIPDKTGVEVLLEIRGKNGTGLPDTRIVIMTNFEQDDATRQSMEKLADAYVIKAETTPKRMVSVVQELIGEAGDESVLNTTGKK